MGGIDRSLIAAAPISDAGGQVPGDDAAVQAGDDDHGDDDETQILTLLRQFQLSQMINHNHHHQWWDFVTDRFPPSSLWTDSHHGGNLSWWE